MGVDSQPFSSAAANRHGPDRHLYAAAADRPRRQFQSRFQRDHRRHGHLFQNRYKSILCQEYSYLLELVRYIHLNPLRAKLVVDMDALGKYPFCGHGVIMGKHVRGWQEIDTVLAYFGKRVEPARRSYRAFVTKGIEQGRRWDLTGGGLIRSAGGWAAVKALKMEKVHVKSDERVLGDGDLWKKFSPEAGSDTNGNTP